MKNEIETRILKLADLAGISTDEKSSELAELKGYAAGFHLIFGDFEAIAYDLSPATATGFAFGLLCDMFGIEYSISNSEKRKMILDGFALQSIDYNDGEFEQKITNAHFNATLSNGTLSLSATPEHTPQDYKELAKILENYAAPNLYITFDGDGMTFEKWENLNFMFNEFDKLKFTFAMLDTMKTEDL